VRFPTFGERLYGFAEIITRQEGGVPGRHVTQSLPYSFLGVHRHHILDPLHNQWWVGGDGSRGFPCRREHTVPVRVDVVDEADPFGTRRVDVLAGHREFPYPALADDRAEPLQTPEIGDDGHSHLAHAESGVLAGHAHVGRADHIDPTTDTPAGHRCDDRFATLRDGGDRILHPADLTEELRTWLRE